jgi:hypothetical protein
MSADISATMAAAMGEENRRRELAAQQPGAGALLPLPQPPAGPAIGVSNVDPPVVGEGYAMEAPPSPLQVVVPHGIPVYGQRPEYAAPEVGGVGFQAGRQEPPIRVLVGTRSAAAEGLTVLSAPGRPGLWARLRGKLRRG